jgi:hypothetical protein
LFLKSGSQACIIAAAFMIEIVNERPFDTVLEDYSDEAYPPGQYRVFLFDHLSRTPGMMV